MFNIDDIVDVEGRNDFMEYGKITELTEDDKAIVHFRLPREPKDKEGGWGGSCDKCKWPGFLSISGNTGEIICMRSGCGYGHGFEERDEIIPIAKLINISTQRRNKSKKELCEKIDALLSKAVHDDIITSEKRDHILKELG